MILTKQNKYKYFYNIHKWIKSCNTNEQLDNIQSFIYKIARQTIDNKGIYYSVGMPYKVLNGLNLSIKKQRIIIKLNSNEVEENYK